MPQAFGLATNLGRLRGFFRYQTAASPSQPVSVRQCRACTIAHVTRDAPFTRTAHDALFPLLARHGSAALWAHHAAAPPPAPTLAERLAVSAAAKRPGAAAGSVLHDALSRLAGLDAREEPEHAHAGMRAALLRALAAKNPFWTGEFAAALLDEAAPINRTDCPHERRGRWLALVFAAFALHILEESRGADRVFFLAREGHALLRWCRSMSRALSCPRPRFTYLAVSRAATFLPSLAAFDLEAVLRLHENYPGQTLRTLAHNFSLPEGAFLDAALRVGWTRTSLDEPITDPAAHTGLHALLNDPGAQRVFAAARDGARAALLAYLHAKGWRSGERVLLVDVGWRGSMQTNLLLAHEGGPTPPAVRGVYLGLKRSAFDDRTDGRFGASRHGYLADTSRAEWPEHAVFKCASAFEMFTTAPHPSVTGYRRGTDGSVRPVLAPGKEERALRESEPHRLVRGALHAEMRTIIAAAPELQRGVAGLSADALRPWVLDVVRRHVLYPCRADADSFLAYGHVENFGVHRVSRYGFTTTPARLFREVKPHRFTRHLLDAIRRHFWPEGIIRRSGVPGATLLFDLLETRRALRFRGR